MAEQILCVSYFDQIIGPNIFYSNENLKKDSFDYPDIGRILEFQDQEGTFIFAFRKFQTVNFIFYVDSKFARGGKELIMITYMIKSAYFRNEIADVFKYLESKNPILENFASDLMKLDELPTILHTSKSSLDSEQVVELGSEHFKTKFLKIFNIYLAQLSPEYNIAAPIKSKPDLKKVFIFGARGVGKTTLLKNIEEIQFHNQKNNDLPTQIYEIIVENMEILSYDCVEHDFICEKCQNYGNCSNAQGYVLLLNLSDKSSIEEAKNMYNSILRRCEAKKNGKVPFVILGNRIDDNDDNDDYDVDFIYDNLNLRKLDECNLLVKYFNINIKQEPDKIMEAIRWLARHML